MRIVSIGNMVKALDGMRGTKYLTSWEEGFVESIVSRSDCGKDTTKLTDGQVQTVEGIWQKHFA